MATVTVTPTVDAANWPPRVRLDVSTSGTPTVTSTTVQRINPDGSLVPVRTPDGNPLPLSPSGLVYDTEVPYQAPVSYTTVESPTVVSAQVTVPESRIWLVHPGVPALSTPVELFLPAFMEDVRPVAQVSYVVMGRVNPVVHTDGFRKSSQSNLTVLAEDPDTYAAILAVTADASDLLLNIPATLGLGVGTQYIALGQMSISRLTDIGYDQHRVISMPFVVVDRPVGGSQAQRTYADLMTYATYADLKAAYPTYADLLAGP